MSRRLPLILACLTALAMGTGTARADPQCRVESRYSPGNPLAPDHRVSFVFTGVDHERVSIHVDDARVFSAELATEDRSTDFSGAADCLLAGRYGIRVRIGEVEGLLHLDISERTTIYLSARDGMMEFNIWGPDAPGLD